jgi:hypothetical protein
LRNRDALQKIRAKNYKEANEGENGGSKSEVQRDSRRTIDWANKEDVREYSRKYREANLEAKKEWDKLYYKENRTAITERKRLLYGLWRLRVPRKLYVMFFLLSCFPPPRSSPSSSPSILRSNCLIEKFGKLQRTLGNFLKRPVTNCR